MNEQHFRANCRSFTGRKACPACAASAEKGGTSAKSVYPLSYNQQGIWFLYQLAPESTVYNVNFAARISSDLNVPAMRRAFQTLVDRHPSLRTTFLVDAGKPIQQVHEQREVHFEETDAAAWSDDELKARLLEEAYRPFDLERGPAAASESVHAIGTGAHPAAGGASHRHRFLVARDTPE